MHIITVITYVTRKSVKGRIMAEKLADGPETQFPDDGIFALEGENRWQLFFDGAANRRGNGIGMLLVDPTDEHIPIAVKLNFEVTNNAAEYEACIAGLEAAFLKGTSRSWKCTVTVLSSSTKCPTCGRQLIQV